MFCQVIDRYLPLFLGIAGALLASQLPGYALQYMQNLLGRLDELEPIVEEFAADVQEYNFTLEEALDECAMAIGLLDALCDTFAEVVLRYEDLRHHYQELEAASEYQRPFVLMRHGRQEIVLSVWEGFEPAVPVTKHGFVYAGCGFLVCFVGLSALLHLLNYVVATCCTCTRAETTRAAKKQQSRDSGWSFQHRVPRRMTTAVTGVESEHFSHSDVEEIQGNNGSISDLSDSERGVRLESSR